jgi:hypothetical protein
MDKQDFTTVELTDLPPHTEMLANILIREGRLREREEIIELLMSKYDDVCCCDSSSFGNHYLSSRQPDNLIKLISDRSLGQPPIKKRVWDGNGWNYRA